MFVYPCVTLNHLNDFRYYEVLLALYPMMVSVIVIRLPCYTARKFSVIVPYRFDICLTVHH